MAQMTRTSQLSGKQALAGAAVSRRPFTSARAAPRSLVVRAEQGPNDAAMRVIGAVAAAQVALLPLAGAAAADVFPSIAAVGTPNPAAEFAAKSKATVNKAKAAVAPDPLQTLQAKTKAAAQDAKSVAAKNGLTPDPVKDLQNKAKSATKKVSNPAAEFANKGKKAANKAANKAPAAVKKAANKAKISNPAKEFAAKSQQAKQKAKGALAGTPLATIGMNDLQKNVLFGIGEKKASKVADKAADKASAVADKASDKASDVADKASDVGETAAKKVDESTPNSFSIFDADSVEDARQKLKANIDEAVNATGNPAEGGDPAERVVSVGKPGETQEENAERIRREAENGPVEGGDARAPTN